MGKKKAPKEFQKVLNKSWESNINGTAANRAKSHNPAARSSAQHEIRRINTYGPDSAIKEAVATKGKKFKKR